MRVTMVITAMRVVTSIISQPINRLSLLSFVLMLLCSKSGQSKLFLINLGSRKPENHSTRTRGQALWITDTRTKQVDPKLCRTSLNEIGACWKPGRGGDFVICTKGPILRAQRLDSVTVNDSFL